MPSVLIKQDGRNESVTRFFRIVALALLLGGCARTEMPTRLVHICVNDEDGMVLLKGELIHVARAKQMKFVDASEMVRRDLDVVGYSGPDQSSNRNIVSFRVEDDDKMGLSATNVGLPPYQVAIGFSVGKDQAGSLEFAEETIRHLRTHWSVEEALEGSGVLPNPKCR